MRHLFVVLCATLTLGLAGCARDTDTSPNADAAAPLPAPQEVPASEVDLLCTPGVEEILIKVAGAKTASDKSETNLKLTDCEQLKTSAAGETQSCATRFGGKLNLDEQAALCQQLVIASEEAKAKKLQEQEEKKKEQAAQVEKDKQQAQAEEDKKDLAEESTAQPQPQNTLVTDETEKKDQTTDTPVALQAEQKAPTAELKAARVMALDDLSYRHWVYVPSLNTFGHVAADKVIDNNVVVRISHKLENGKTDHLSLNLDKLNMPVAEGQLNLCGQTETLGKETLVSTKENNIYKVVAAFEKDEKIVAKLQTAPTGLKAYFPRTHLVDEEPVLLDLATITGLPVQCNGFCEGQTVQSLKDPSESYIVQKIFCDGTMLLGTGGYVFHSEFVDNKSNYTSIR